MLGIPNVTLIVAVDQQNGIGKSGTIPWNIPKDMKYFTQTTTTAPVGTHNVVIMGKNTWKSIPAKYRALPERCNVVITTTMTQEDIDQENTTGASTRCFRTLEDGLAYCRTADNIHQVYIIGGASLYTDAVRKGYVHRVLLTKIGDTYDCDTFFDWVKSPKWSYQLEKADAQHGFDHKRSKSVPLVFETYKMDVNGGEDAYLSLLNRIMQKGDHRNGRNGMTYSLFGDQLSFDLSVGFPLLTTKRVFFRGIVEELLWFLRGDTNSQHLSEKGVHIWEPNTTREFLDNRGLPTYEVGDIGPMYGYNWRHFGAPYQGMAVDHTNKGYDQLRNIIDLLHRDPMSRRILMTTFDPSQVDNSVLAPCHGIAVQFYVRNSYLDCKMYMRSVDTPVGLPFNIASYATLVFILCQITGHLPGMLYITMGDTHIYACHENDVITQIMRHPFPLPDLRIIKPFAPTADAVIPFADNALRYIQSLRYEDFQLDDYVHHPSIKMEMVA